MQRASLLSLVTMAVSLPAAAQQEVPTLESLWEIVQQQQAVIDALQAQLEAAEADADEVQSRIEETEQMVVATGDFIDSLEIDGPARRTTVGGYGELHYNDLAADDAARDLEEIDYHRFVLFFAHQFSDRIRFQSELELEHSLAGDGKPGEIELEQAYVNFTLNDHLAAQGGLFLVPVGILNETHEPPTFYGVERNDVESIIIPSTWWEAGAGLSGNSATGLSWNAALHSGLAMPTTGSDAFRVRAGRQKVAEALASDLAATLRLSYTGLPGLELSASLNFQRDPSQRPGDGLDSGTLLTAHAIYQSGPFSLRALYAGWSFDGFAVEAAGVDAQSGWFLEPSYKLNPRWGVYARYEDVEGARVQDVFEEWEVGLSYWPVPDVTIKADYRSREHGLAAADGRDFDGIDLGIGYQF